MAGSRFAILSECEESDDQIIKTDSKPASSMSQVAEACMAHLMSFLKDDELSKVEFLSRQLYAASCRVRFSRESPRDISYFYCSSGTGSVPMPKSIRANADRLTESYRPRGPVGEFFDDDFDSPFGMANFRKTVPLSLDGEYRQYLLACIRVLRGRLSLLRLNKPLWSDVFKRKQRQLIKHALKGVPIGNRRYSTGWRWWDQIEKFPHHRDLMYYQWVMMTLKAIIQREH